MSITDTNARGRTASAPSYPTHRPVLNYAQVNTAWQALGMASAKIHREATHCRDTTRLRDLTTGLFTALTAVGVALPDADVAVNDDPQPGPGKDLSCRELEVLRGISAGKSNAEIGVDLFIVEDTVKTHARRAYRKLGARDRAHAVALAFRKGLLT